VSPKTQVLFLPRFRNHELQLHNKSSYDKKKNCTGLPDGLSSKFARLEETFLLMVERLRIFARELS